MPVPNTTIEKTTMPHVAFTSVSYVVRDTRSSSCMQRPTATAPRSPVNHMTTCMANVMRAPSRRRHKLSSALRRNTLSARPNTQKSCAHAQTDEYEYDALLVTRCCDLSARR